MISSKFCLRRTNISHEVDIALRSEDEMLISSSTTFAMEVSLSSYCTTDSERTEICTTDFRALGIGHHGGLSREPAPLNHKLILSRQNTASARSVDENPAMG